MINSGVYINLALIPNLCGGAAGVLVPIPLDILLVIRQGDIEIKGLIPLTESQAYEGVLPAAILDPEHEVARGIEDGLDGGVALAGIDEAGGEEIAGIGVLEADLAAGVAGDDAEAAGPDLVGLEPLAALVAAAGGAGRDLVDGDFADDEEGVLEGLLVVVVRHRCGALSELGVGCFEMQEFVLWKVK